MLPATMQGMAPFKRVHKDLIRLAIYGAMPSIIGNTLSFNYKEGNFTFIPEVRFDSSSEDIFKKKDGSAAGSSAYVLFATTYSF